MLTCLISNVPAPCVLSVVLYPILFTGGPPAYTTWLPANAYSFWNEEGVLPSYFLNILQK